MDYLKMLLVGETVTQVVALSQATLANPNAKTLSFSRENTFVAMVSWNKELLVFLRFTPYLTS
jgi:hypothetical protein